MELSNFVSFYRSVKQSTANNAVDICGEIQLTQKNITLLKSLNKTRNIGNFKELILNGEEVTIEELSPSSCSVEVIFRIASSGDAHIYKDINNYLEMNKSLSRGDCSSEYYILDEDYFSEENKDDLRFLKIQKLCEVIKGLAELAHYHDLKSDSDKLSLVFVSDGELSRTKPVILVAQLKPNMLELPEIKTTILSSLLEGDHNPHKLQEQGTFRASIVEFFGNNSNDTSKNFEEIIKHWNEFTLLFNRNFETYISGFAFHKAKQEVIDAELSSAEQFSKIIGELTGKLLGIPLSLAAIIGVVKTESVVEQILIVLGILLASYIISETLHNQKRQFKRISNASSLTFAELNSKKNTYPSDLCIYITKAVKMLEKSKKSLARTLYFFNLLSWVPPIIAITYIGVLQKKYLIESFQYFCGFLP
tara:strand:+ start:21905 stop:23164 length:1260 start_codon:yes stop_codon:yes gene_type:complete